MAKLEDEPEKRDTGGMNFGKPGSAKRTLTSVNTHIYVGTEVGLQIVSICEWYIESSVVKSLKDALLKNVWLFLDWV